MSKSAPGKNATNGGVDMNSILRQAGEKNNNSTKTVYLTDIYCFSN